jgi:quercetin dioxygenase-like cupin family protein
MHILLPTAAFAALLLSTTTLAQQPGVHLSHASGDAGEHEGTGGMCIPAESRAGRKEGCFVIGAMSLGKLPDIGLYWHIDRYPNRAAAEKEQSARSTVVEAYGSIWMFSIADKSFLTSHGEHVDSVGPLPLGSAVSYTAWYMEATFAPGMKSAVHRHTGPEAWYVLSGEQCLETPSGKTVIGTGQSGLVPGGPPMMLTATGTGERHSLVLILGDSSLPNVLPANDWRPKGLCLSP